MCYVPLSKLLQHSSHVLAAMPLALTLLPGHLRHLLWPVSHLHRLLCHLLWLLSLLILLLNHGMDCVHGIRILACCHALHPPPLGCILLLQSPYQSSFFLSLSKWLASAISSLLDSVASFFGATVQELAIAGGLTMWAICSDIPKSHKVDPPML